MSFSGWKKDLIVAKYFQFFIISLFPFNPLRQLFCLLAKNMNSRNIRKGGEATRTVTLVLECRNAEIGSPDAHIGK